MNVIQTNIDDVVIIEPRIFEDSRGYFFESFSQLEFEEKVRPINFVQDNESKSSYGVCVDYISNTHHIRRANLFVA